MATVEINDDTISEIKTLAKEFLDNELNGPGSHDAVVPSWEVYTIGIRMVEALYPKEYAEYFRKLLGDIQKEISQKPIFNNGAKTPCELFN